MSGIYHPYSHEGGRQMRHRLGLLVFFLLTLGTYAYGQSLVEQPGDHDQPCFWEDDICFDYQANGNQTGVAPGITTCTTNIGCKACVVPENVGKFTCATIPEGNGYCKCEQKASGACDSSGSCTYKR